MRKVSVWINFVLILLTSNFWRAEIFLGRFSVRSATSESSPSAKCVGLFFPNLLLAGPESSVQHQEEAFFFLLEAHFNYRAFLITIGRKMTATNNRMFERLDEMGSFCLNKFNPLLLQICFIWKSLQCMPSFVWISTNRTTQHKKLNIFKQTVSKNIVTRPANNGCEEHLHVLYAIVKQNFGCSTRNVTEKMAPFKMANASNLEELLQSKNGLLRKNEWYLWYTWYIY